MFLFIDDIVWKGQMRLETSPNEPTRPEMISGSTNDSLSVLSILSLTFTPLHFLLDFSFVGKNPFLGLSNKVVISQRSAQRGWSSICQKLRRPSRIVVFSKLIRVLHFLQIKCFQALVAHLLL